MKNSIMTGIAAMMLLAGMGSAAWADDLALRSFSVTGSVGKETIELYNKGGAYSILYRDARGRYGEVTEKDLAISCNESCSDASVSKKGQAPVDFASGSALGLVKEALQRKQVVAEVLAQSGENSRKLREMNDNVANISKIDWDSVVDPNNKPGISVSVMGGVTQTSAGESSPSYSVFARAPLSMIAPLRTKYGNFGISGGFSQLIQAGDKSDVVQNLGSESVTYHNDSAGLALQGTTTRYIERDKPGLSVNEFVRADYETPRIKGVGLYGGVGLGYAQCDNNTYTVKKTVTSFANNSSKDVQILRSPDGASKTLHPGTSSLTQTEVLGTTPGDTWSQVITTAFVGVKMDLIRVAPKLARALFVWGLPRHVDLIGEYERVMGREEVQGNNYRVGLGFEF